MDEAKQERTRRTEFERGWDDASRAAAQIVALAADFYPMRPSDEFLAELEGAAEMRERLWPHLRRFRERLAKESVIALQKEAE